MSITELCFVVIAITVVVLAVYAVKTLNNLNRTLDHVHDIAKSVNEKTKAMDEFLAKAKELDGIIKYAKIGYDVVKNIKKDKKDTKEVEK